MISIAIISPEKSLEPINHVIATHDFGCEFNKYIYRELSDIDVIYEDCKNSCDVIFFSGELGYHYIRNHIPNVRIPCAFTAYGPKNILSILLNFHMKHPEIPINRVFVDFLTPLNGYMDIQRYIEPKYMPYMYKSKVYDYEHITAYTRKLWDAGKIDIVISRSINNLHVLDDLHIPYQAVFPTEFMIQESMEAAINQLLIQKATEADCLIIIVRLPFESSANAEEREYQQASVYKLLVDFRRIQNMDFSIKIGLGRFELESKVLDESDATAKLQFFLRYLKKHLSFSFRFGAGLHHSADLSHLYAETALQESLRYDGNDGFLSSGEPPSFTGPLSALQLVKFNYSNDRVAAFARRNKINESNAVKLVGLFELDEHAELTAVSVGELLNITPRSANRILQQLYETHMIYEAPSTASLKKGRPMRSYRFSAKQCKEELL